MRKRNQSIFLLSLLNIAASMVFFEPTVQAKMDRNENNDSLSWIFVVIINHKYIVGCYSYRSFVILIFTDYYYIILYQYLVDRTKDAKTVQIANSNNKHNCNETDAKRTQRILLKYTGLIKAWVCVCCLCDILIIWFPH